MASPKDAARTSPFAWALLLLLFAVLAFLGYRQWSHGPVVNAPAASPQAAPAARADSTGRPAGASQEQPPSASRAEVMIG